MIAITFKLNDILFHMLLFIDAPQAQEELFFRIFRHYKGFGHTP